jgi:hypothetical protein
MNLSILSDGTHGTLAHYFIFAVPLTTVTIWLIMALQYRKKDPNHLIHDDNYVPIWRKLSWPLIRLRKTFRRGATRSATMGTFSRPNSMRVSRPTSAFVVLGDPTTIP